MNLIIIDDATYSGTHVASQIDEITRGCNNPNLEIFLIVPFYTEMALGSIMGVLGDLETNVSLQFFGSSKMKTITEYAKEEGFEINWKIFNKIFYPEIKTGNDRETYNPTTTWFWHKIANNFGTLTKLIEKYSLIKPTREEINQELENRTDFLLKGAKKQ